jgi:hypothetical protein
MEQIQVILATLEVALLTPTLPVITFTQPLAVNTFTHLQHTRTLLLAVNMRTQPLVLFLVPNMRTQFLRLQQVTFQVPQSI